LLAIEKVFGEPYSEELGKTYKISNITYEPFTFIHRDFYKHHGMERLTIAKDVECSSDKPQRGTHPFVATKHFTICQCSCHKGVRMVTPCGCCDKVNEQYIREDGVIDSDLYYDSLVREYIKTIGVRGAQCGEAQQIARNLYRFPELNKESVFGKLDSQIQKVRVDRTACDFKDLSRYLVSIDYNKPCTVISGETASGKTTVAIQIAVEEYLKGNSVFIVTFENTTFDINKKIRNVVSKRGKKPTGNDLLWIQSLYYDIPESTNVDKIKESIDNVSINANKSFNILVVDGLHFNDRSAGKEPIVLEKLIEMCKANNLHLITTLTRYAQTHS